MFYAFQFCAQMSTYTEPMDCSGKTASFVYYAVTLYLFNIIIVIMLVLPGTQQGAD